MFPCSCNNIHSIYLQKFTHLAKSKPSCKIRCHVWTKKVRGPAALHLSLWADPVKFDWISTSQKLDRGIFTTV